MGELLLARNGFSETGKGLVFTNARGGVVFVDSSFARLAHQVGPRFRDLDSLKSVLGIAQETALKLLGDVLVRGRFETRQMELPTQSGSPIPAWGMGVASHDRRGNFLGMDIVLARNPNDRVLQREIMDHTDVLELHIQQRMSEARALHNRTYLQVYLSAQLDALQVLAVRMAGGEIRKTLEDLINMRGRAYGWPMTLQDGEIQFGGGNTQFTTYGNLLKAAASYIADIVGKRMVVEELSIIDQWLDPQTRKMVTDMGLSVEL